MLRINQARIFLANQFLHDGEHVDLSVVQEHLGVFLIRYPHLNVSEMHVIDAVPCSEITAHFHGVLAHFPCHAAIKRDPICLAGHDLDEVFPSLHAPHDLF